MERASFPPRGWNSYDSFCWTISEEEFLQNAEIISQRLKAYGFEYVVVDYLWYRRKVPGAYVDSLGFDVIDQWGRMIPDPDRWPSSKGGKGFTEVAKKVHSMGLKFGIHVMRGISTQAYNANTPILDTIKGGAYEDSGRQWRAQDIGIKEKACAWMQHGFMSVNTKLEAGRAFLRSLYEQYAEWGVDFVKHDCVFGDDLDLEEITFVSEVLKKLDHPILYSLSPGTSVTPTMAKDVSGLVNMYRITGDDWDTWGDVAAILMFQGSNQGPHRTCKLSIDEQKTQMTLWAMAKSPLMFGGDVRKLDDTTYNLITNPTILEINYFSSNNREFPYVSSRKDSNTKTLAYRSRRSPKEVSTSSGHDLGLNSCKDPSVNGWSIKALDRDMEQICWMENLGSHGPLCLYKRKPLLDLDKGAIYGKKKLPSYSSDGLEFCLDASARHKLTSKELKSRSFSPCRWDANQMWELKNTGALISNYSGLCAQVNPVKGEIYVAFFNLNPEKTIISAKISDMAKVFPGKNWNQTSCRCREVWSGKDFGVLKDSITMAVEMHGSALFVLNSTRAPVGTTTRTEVAGDRIQRLVSEFESLEEPIERVKRLLDYAARLPPFDESARLPGNRVMGCTTQVWLEARMDENGRMRFRADSDSEITKGFISCLIWLLDGAEPAEVVAVKSEDLAAMNVGLYGKAQSRVNTWLNVLINMQNRTKALAAGRKELPLEPLPSLVVNTDGIGGTGTFAQAQYMISYNLIVFYIYGSQFLLLHSNMIGNVILTLEVKRKRVRSSFIDDEAVVDSDDEEEEEDDAEDEMHILSAVALDNVKNYIFIEVGKEAHVREVADVDNVQRGVRVTLIPQIDSQAIANKLDGGEEVKKVAFVPPCFVNGDEASTSFGVIIRVESEAFKILSGVPKRPEVSLVRLREIKCKIEKKSNVLDGYKNTVSVNDVFRIGDGPCKGNSYMRYGKTPRRIPPLPRRLSRGGPHLESGGRNRGGRGGHDSLVVDRHDVVVPAPRCDLPPRYGLGSETPAHPL
ncbi:hypothetical protein GH714_028939 [Hevea brasiliensis]|uniref:Alpha-galactosidase n=1 Tax=Hevea brasiliensis TaxID=3981 RepID=A0A6A6KXJ7_HEVBR|nr:hypothetical protein GH714_028939 [Hevea brasiliensis]